MSNIFKQVNGGIAKFVAQPAVGTTLILAARLLAAAIFIIAGYGKLGNYAGTQGYMAAAGVPGALLPLVIALELGGGLALLFGFQTRLVGFLLSMFCIATALIFHSGAAQHIMFLKNLSMAGGMLAFTVFGGGRASLDGESRSS
ncbi:MAG: DoxX family protein [Gallionella sp.]|nr:DoxX family protein [Gallionella sp.]